MNKPQRILSYLESYLRNNEEVLSQEEIDELKELIKYQSDIVNNIDK